jgi:hypothetical protein
MPKISDLTTITGAGVAAGDLWPVVDVSANETKKITTTEKKIAMGLSSYLPLAGGTMTGAITLSGDPASSLQAATKQYVDGIATNLGKRQTVRAATTANIVIASALNSGDVIDGVTLATSDLVLVKNQSTPAQNGIYVVDVSPTRSVEFDTFDEHPGALVAVQEGTANAESIWLCTSNVGGTLNTTPIVFSASSTSGALLAATATLSVLNDVNITEGAGIDGYSLTWNNATSKWIATLAAGSTYSAGTGLILTGTTFSVDADLAALAANSTNGLWAHTGSGTGSARTLTAGNGISIANGDGVSGNPTVSADINKQTIWIPASAMTPRTTSGAASGTAEMTTNKNMVATLDFDSSTQEFSQFDIAMPKSWNEGTITFIPYWSHAATTTNFGVVWGVDAIAISDDDTMDVAFGTAQTSTDTGGTTNDLYVAPESSAVTVAGSPAAGDLVQFRIHRNPADGSDTMAIDARLHGVKILYVIDALKDD